MARKSKELRLNQAESLSVAWSKSPFSGDKTHRFIDDMISRLHRGKGLSTGQRRWLDSLIEEGVPSVASSAVDAVETIESAITAFHEDCALTHRWEINVLRDFRNRVAKGYNMSEKQSALLKRLTTDAEKITAGQGWSPSADELVTLCPQLPNSTMATQASGRVTGQL